MKGQPIYDVQKDLVNLRGQIEEQLSIPGLPVEEKVELFTVLNFIKKRIRAAKQIGLCGRMLPPPELSGLMIR